MTAENSNSDKNVVNEDTASSSEGYEVNGQEVPESNDNSELKEQEEEFEQAENSSENQESTSDSDDNLSGKKDGTYLEDLQRLQAEYQNYRKRVERDRGIARDSGAESIVTNLLPVLDDIDAARDAGDLEGGPFASIAQKLDDILAKQGVERYGEVGAEFDPTQYEALLQQPSNEVDTETVSQILRPGYRMKDKIIRAAQVGVATPEQ